MSEVIVWILDNENHSTSLHSQNTVLFLFDGLDCFWGKKISIYYSAGVLLIASHQLLFSSFKYWEAGNFEET